MKTELILKEVVPGLNGKNGLIRQHFHQAKQTRERFRLIFMSQTKNRHPGSVCVHYIGYKCRFMDWDNFSASFKHIGDALVKAKIITDDNPKIIQQFNVQQIKVSKLSEQKTVIIIQDL